MAQSDPSADSFEALLYLEKKEAEAQCYFTTVVLLHVKLDSESEQAFKRDGLIKKRADRGALFENAIEQGESEDGTASMEICHCASAITLKRYGNPMLVRLICVFRIVLT